MLTLITGNIYNEVLRQVLIILHLIHYGLDLIGRVDQVLTGTFHDVERDYILSAETSKTLALFDGIAEFGDVAQIDGGAPSTASYNHILQVGNGLELSAYPQRPTHIAHFDLTAGDVVVLPGDRIFDIHKTDARRGHLIGIDVHLDLAFGSTHNLRAGDLGEFFKAVLQFIGVLFQFNSVVVTTHIYEHDGHFTESKFLYVGLLRQVGGQVAFRLIDRILDFLLGQLSLDVGVELNHDQAVIRLRSALDLVHTRTTDPLELFFDGARNQIFDVLR